MLGTFQNKVKDSNRETARRTEKITDSGVKGPSAQNMIDQSYKDSETLGIRSPGTKSNRVIHEYQARRLKNTTQRTS
jgi:hypothetical protein